MTDGDKIVARIDKAVADKNNRPRNRRHLGGSLIGKSCARAIYYNWRWFYVGNHIGRMFRLWNRGHLEEHRFVEYLRLAGYEVRDYAKRLMYHPESDSYTAVDWDDAENENKAYDQGCEDVSEDRFHIERCERREQHLPKEDRTLQQYGFKTHRGHFAGSDDGRIRGPMLPDGWGLLEEKTYNDKRFKVLAAKGVLSADATYYNQMQTYMQAHNLKWGLFIAVNKNDDTLYVEIVHYREEIGEAYLDRAGKIIDAAGPPARISNDASWWTCKMCDYREICHKGDTPAKNCRTCTFSEAADDCRFYCHKFMQLIPVDFEAKGCDDWDAIK